MEQLPVHKDGEVKPERVLIYDGHCRLCTAAKESVERLGKDLDVRWLPYRSAEAACRLGADYSHGRPDAAVLIEPDGEIKRGLDAFLPLLPGLRGGGVLQALMKVPFMKPLAYGLYWIVARYRYRLFGAVRDDR